MSQIVWQSLWQLAPAQGSSEEKPTAQGEQRGYAWIVVADGGRRDWKAQGSGRTGMGPKWESLLQTSWWCWCSSYQHILVGLETGLKVCEKGVPRPSCGTWKTTFERVFWSLPTKKGALEWRLPIRRVLLRRNYQVLIFWPAFSLAKGYPKREWPLLKGTNHWRPGANYASCSWMASSFIFFFFLLSVQRFIVYV